MSLKLYMDHHVKLAITEGLRLRHVDVLMAYEDGAHQLGDPALLDRAMQSGRVLFTQDDDLLREATRRQAENIEFAGVIYVHQHNLSTRQCIDELELIAGVFELEEWSNRVEYLPLKR
jgi:predicted nuclease of predicted toxin-antitoxin system